MANKKIVRSFSQVISSVRSDTVKAGIKTVNRAAFTARKNAINLVNKNFTIRSPFTEKGIQTEKCPSSARDLNEIKAYTGASKKIAYMERQETGGSKRTKSGRNLVIPNTRTRDGSNSNLVGKNFYYRTVKKNTIKSKRKGSHKSNLVARASLAADKSDKFIRIGESFFQVTNFRKGKNAVSFRTKQILNLKHKTTYTPANPWLEPASEYAANLMQDFYNQEMDKL